MPSWLSQFVGADYAPIASWALAAVVVLIALFVVIFVAKRALGGIGGPRSRRGPRLAVMDVTPIDQRRKLVLVRRDEVEHLILIGGQNDLVVEASILRVPASLRNGRADAQPRHEPELEEAAAGLPRAAGRGASPLTRPVPRSVARAPAGATLAPPVEAETVAMEPAIVVAPAQLPMPVQAVEPAPAIAVEEPPVAGNAVRIEPDATTTTPFSNERTAPVIAPAPQPIRARPTPPPIAVRPVPRTEQAAPPAEAPAADASAPAPAATRAIPSFLRRTPELPFAPTPAVTEPEQPNEPAAEAASQPFAPLPPSSGFQTVEIQPARAAPPVEIAPPEPTVEPMPAPPAPPARREPNFSSFTPRSAGPVSPVIAAAERQRDAMRSRQAARVEPEPAPALPVPTPQPPVEPEAPETKVTDIKVSEKLPEPTEEIERRPLSVRSFASAIQNRKSSFEPPAERREPAPQPVAAMPVAAAAPAVTTRAAPEADGSSLEDFLSAELNSDFGANFWEAEVDTTPAPSPATVAEPAEAPARPRRMTLEEEMERLLGDFDFDTSNDRRTTR